MLQRLTRTRQLLSGDLIEFYEVSNLLPESWFIEKNVIKSFILNTTDRAFPIA